MIQLDPDHKPIILRALNVLFIIGLSIITLYLLTRYLFPFLIVIILSALLQRPINYIKTKLKVNSIIAVIISLLFILAIITISLGMIIIHLTDMFNSILVHLPLYVETIIEAAKMGVDYFLNYTLPNLETLLNRVNFSLSDILIAGMDNLYSFILSFSQKIANQLVPLITETIMQTIDITSTTIIILILTILLSKDWHVYRTNSTRLLPKNVIKKIIEVYKNFTQIGWGYIKAQCIVSGITTLVLIIGFFFLDIERPFTLAIVIGVFDFVPLIGVGLFLWPWIIYALLTGSYVLTIKLSIIYIIIVCVRQFVEPQLVSKQIGTNSLFVIALGYLSYLFFGIFGILITPILLISIQTIKVSQLDQVIYEYIRFGKRFS